MLLHHELFGIRLRAFSSSPSSVRQTKKTNEYCVVSIPLLCIEFALRSQGMLGMNVPGSVHLFAYFWRTKALKTTDP